MICSTGLFKTGWEKTEEDRNVRLIMAGREHDKEEGGFPTRTERWPCAFFAHSTSVLALVFR